MTTHSEEGMTLDEVLWEITGEETSRTRATETVSQWLRDTSTQAHRSASEVFAPVVTREGGLGSDNMPWRRLSETSRRLLGYLLAQESNPPEGNYLAAVFVGSTLVEQEMNRLLATPAREIVDELVDAQKQHNRKHRTDGLKAWADGRVQCTLGLVVQMMLGLRWGLEQGRPPIQDFLQQNFSDSYAALASNKSLGAALDRLRQKFRNPACHGDQDFFSAEQFEEFARLVVAQDCFRAWRHSPPLSPEGPPPDQGLLHHHLLHSRLPERHPSGGNLSPIAAAGPVDTLLKERFLALQPPSGDPWHLKVWPCPAGLVPTRRVGIRSVTRDMGAAPPLVNEYHLGEWMCLGFSTRRPGYLSIVNLGTTDTLWALCPSNACPDPYLPPGESFLPPPYSLFPRFYLSGDPGIERVVAISTAEPTGLDFSPTIPDICCRELTGNDLDNLLNHLDRLRPGDWSVAQCKFELRSLGTVLDGKQTSPSNDA